MLKKLSNFGKMLNRNEQQSINGGLVNLCSNNKDCPVGYWCAAGICRRKGDSI